jgi:acetolactate synthase-1/2/3 large subunit
LPQVRANEDVIMPQYAIERLYELTKDRDTYITTEVGQHQMWAAQFYHFEEPNRWMTSGGLGTMGYGLPAALGVQVAHPDALVIDIAGDASVQMTIQEMSTAVQYESADEDLHSQQLLHGHGAPVAAACCTATGCRTPTRRPAGLREAGRGLWRGRDIRCNKPDELDDAIMKMIETPGR